VKHCPREWDRSPMHTTCCRRRSISRLMRRLFFLHCRLEAGQAACTSVCGNTGLRSMPHKQQFYVAVQGSQASDRLPVLGAEAASSRANVHDGPPPTIVAAASTGLPSLTKMKASPEPSPSNSEKHKKYPGRVSGCQAIAVDTHQILCKTDQEHSGADEQI
jgi:hypothetical protein